MTNALRVLAPTVLLAACGLPLAAAEDATAADANPAAAAVANELMTVEGGRQVKVSAKKDLAIPFSTSENDDIATRELWYSSFDGVQWSAWTKHGLSFPRETPITWSPAEGHWRIYIRPIKKSGLAAPAPDAETHAKVTTLKNVKEFIIDRTAPRVTVSTPEARAKLRGGVKYPIKWEAADPYLRSSPITIEWSRDGKAWEVIASDQPNNGSYEWTVPKDMTTTGVIKVSATDKAGNRASAENGNVLVDSVNPRGRVTGPAISARQDVALDTEVSDAGPAGLSKAQLWISQDDGTSWTEGPYLSEPFKQAGWKAPADGRYRLYVLAVDQAGNPSPTPKGKAEDQFVLTVDSTQPTVLLGSAIGIVEANVPAGSRTAFKAGTRVAVPFTIKDANLQPSSVTIAIQTDAAKGWTMLAENQSSDTAFRFELPATATKTARIRVTAKDIAGNIGEAVAGEVFQIDTTVDTGVIGEPEL